MDNEFILQFKIPVLVAGQGAEIKHETGKIFVVLCFFLNAVFVWDKTAQV